MHRLVTMLHLRWSTTAVAIGGIIATGAVATMAAVDADIEPHRALFQCFPCMTCFPASDLAAWAENTREAWWG